MAGCRYGDYQRQDVGRKNQLFSIDMRSGLLHFTANSCTCTLQISVDCFQWWSFWFSFCNSTYQFINFLKNTQLIFFDNFSNFSSNFLSWSIFAANTFLGDSVAHGKKLLAMYPLCLFYIVIAWIVVTHYPV